MELNPGSVSRGTGVHAGMSTTCVCYVGLDTADFVHCTCTCKVIIANHYSDCDNVCKKTLETCRMVFKTLVSLNFLYYVTLVYIINQSVHVKNINHLNQSAH